MKKFLFIAAVLASALGGCGHREAPQTPLPDKGAILQELREADKLVLASMSVTKVAKYESDAWYKIGSKMAVFSYDTYLRAYVDLSRLEPSDLEFNDADHTVTLTLPAVQTELTGRDMELREDYENVGFFRSKIDSKDRARVKEIANADFKKEVAENPQFANRLRETAERQGRRYFEALLDSTGYTATVKFKGQ